MFASAFRVKSSYKWSRYIVDNCIVVHNNMPSYIKSMKACKTPESALQTAVDGWAYVFLALKGYKFTGGIEFLFL